MNKYFFLLIFLSFLTSAQMNDKKRIAVFCSADDKVDHTFKEQAFQVGAFLGSTEYILITGGSKTGLMNEVMNGYSQSGNPENMIGILPTIFEKLKVEHPKLNPNKIIWTETIHERLDALQKNADIFLVLPGGFGTLQELLDVAVPKQFGLHKKRILLMNYKNFWKEFLNLIEHMKSEQCVSEAHSQLIETVSTIEELKNLLLQQTDPKEVGLDTYYWQANP